MGSLGTAWEPQEIGALGWTHGYSHPCVPLVLGGVSVELREYRSAPLLLKVVVGAALKHFAEILIFVFGGDMV